MRAQKGRILCVHKKDGGEKSKNSPVVFWGGAITFVNRCCAEGDGNDGRECENRTEGGHDEWEKGLVSENEA